MTETRLQRVLDQAQRALDDDPSPPSTAGMRRPGLGIHDFLPTGRAPFVATPQPGLVHRPNRRRGLPDVVEPSSVTLMDLLLAVGDELSRVGATELIRRAREHGARRRARVLGLPTDESES